MMLAAAAVVWVLIYSGNTRLSQPSLFFDSEVHCQEFLARSRPSIWVGECVPAPGLLPAQPRPSKPRPRPTPKPEPECRSEVPLCKPA